ncbi:conserved hypothetical protein [Ricinus communis]|uniref:Twin-arginine translocation pathway signal n=1 Tax=Ricinus communis TaxID=3988 RepID=B9TLJ2_RICCO|nr:conserved hypothetical protein [Ricinus communis]
MSRRGALKAVGAAALASVAGQLLLSNRARAALASAPPELNLFLAVSRDLTGKQDLSAVLAQALYPALKASTPDLDAALARLQPLLAQGGPIAAEHKADLALSQAILQGWYLGVVGKGKKPGASPTWTRCPTWPWPARWCRRAIRMALAALGKPSRKSL